MASTLGNWPSRAMPNNRRDTAACEVIATATPQARAVATAVKMASQLPAANSAIS
ncbi:hypothetical protein D3C75_1350210 [compost metagenome]